MIAYLVPAVGALALMFTVWLFKPTKKNKFKKLLTKQQ